MNSELLITILVKTILLFNFLKLERTFPNVKIHIRKFFTKRFLPISREKNYFLE